MPDNFTQSLFKLQASNLMSGAVIKGEADLLNARTEGTRKVITDFNTRLQELEQEPLTTEEQLNTLNEDPTVKKDMGTLEKQLSTFASFSVNIARRQAELNKLYGGAIENLGTIGGTEATNLASMLQGQQKMKISQLDKQGNLPFKTLAYKQSMFQVENLKLDLLQGKIKLEDLKQDRNVANLMANMLTTDDFTNMTFAFNSATGKNKFDLSKFRDLMFLRFGNNPNFAKAWAGIDDYIRKNTRVYRPHFSNINNLLNANIMQNLTLIKGKYNELVDMTKRMGALRFGNGDNGNPDYQWARDEYQNTASAMFQDNPEAHKKDFQFGANPDVISKMLNSDAKKLAQEVFQVMYDPTSDQYYNKHYDALSNLLTTQYGKKTPLTPYYRVSNSDNPNPYPLIDGSGLDPTLIIVPLDAKLFPNGEGGVYDPYNPQTFEGETDVDKTRKEMLKGKRDYFSKSKFEYPSTSPGLGGKLGR